MSLSISHLEVTNFINKISSRRGTLERVPTDFFLEHLMPFLTAIDMTCLMHTSITYRNLSFMNEPYWDSEAIRLKRELRITGGIPGCSRRGIYTLYRYQVSRGFECIRLFVKECPQADFFPLQVSNYKQLSRVLAEGVRKIKERSWQKEKDILGRLRQLFLSRQLIEFASLI